jgi:hypothetical protein
VTMVGGRNWKASAQDRPGCIEKRSGSLFHKLEHGEYAEFIMTIHLMPTFNASMECRAKHPGHKQARETDIRPLTQDSIPLMLHAPSNIA